jgi:hypothetical protein
MERLIRPRIGSIYPFKTLKLLDFMLPASHMENLKIQGLEQTLMHEGGGLEVWLPT